MRRCLFTIFSLLSLMPCVATGAMWVRSFKALDEWYGSVRGVYFEVNSFNGYFDATTQRRYHLRAGVAPNVDVLRAARPFDYVTESADPHVGDFVTRQRWPLRQTDRYDPHAMLFPGVHGSSWLTWARDGPGQYTWVNSWQVPYWLPLLVFAILPIAFLWKAMRRHRPDPAGRCATCGYDLRATPGRCPECGKPATGDRPRPPADGPSHSGLPSSSQTTTLPSASAIGSNVP